MTASAGYYNEIDAIEGFESFEMTEEIVRDHRTGAVRVPGGLVSATLTTPKGPAKLNLPAPVSTLAQFRALEQVVNTNNQRVNAQLAQLSRQVAARSQQGIAGIGMMPLLLIGLMAKKRFDSHVHPEGDEPQPPAATAAGGDSFSSLLPLLLLQPNLLGGLGGSSTPGSGTQDAMSPLLMMLVLTNVLK